MSYIYSQTDELDIDNQEMDEDETEAGKQDQDKKHSYQTVHENWHAGYVPPYRAAYFRARS